MTGKRQVKPEKVGATARLSAIAPADLPLLERLVRAYYLEDGHTFRDDRQPAALKALAAGAPFGQAWLIELAGTAVGYVVLTTGFSVEAGGLEGCIDELYLMPEVRDRGLGRQVLVLIEMEARAIGIRRMFLEVERGNRAIGLYRRAGYAEDDPFLRLIEGIGFYEALEGMLLEISDPIVVGPTNRFGEVWVLADEGEQATGLNDRGGITIRPKDLDPERIQIDDRIAFRGTSGLGTGDLLENVVDVLSYDFENFELLTLDDLVKVDDGPAPETTALSGDDDHLTVATFNVENLAATDDAARFDELAEIVVNNLGSPDIVGLQEVQTTTARPMTGRSTPARRSMP